MNSNLRFFFNGVGAFALMLLFSCKDSSLDLKPSKALVVPQTYQDFQALLDNIEVMNVTPGLTQIASDDFYITSTGWSALTQAQQRNAYTWADDVYENATIADWNTPYQQVFFSNIVLDGLANMGGQENEANYKLLKGSALFYRAYAYFHLAQMFTKPYNAGLLDTAPGIPLKTSSDVNERPGRGTLRQTYDQIMSDLQQAKDLLPLQGLYKTRPCKLAVQALLARAYLNMGLYANAGLAAGECLAAYNKLIDYNTLVATATRPFPVALPNGNDEVIYYTRNVNYSFFNSSQASVDTLLYRSYQANDLRKVDFFTDKGLSIYSFKGSYRGTSDLFTGLATDEMFLIRAECYARNNDAVNAMADLNTLLLKRWKGSFTPYTASNAADALKLILGERRKELVARNIRWSDLRRLNRDANFAVSVLHKINNQVYTLSPDSKKYVFPIPDNEVALSGIAQNDR